MLKEKEILTTGRIAKLIGCSPKIAVHLIDSGEIPGFWVGEHRKALRADVLEWIEHQRVVGARSAPIVLTTNKGLFLPLYDALANNWNIEAVHVADAFGLGLRLAKCPPVPVVVDLAIGRTDARMVAEHLRRLNRLEGRLITLATEDDPSPLGCERTCFEWGKDWSVVAESVALASKGK